MAFTEKQVTQAAADRYEALEDFDSESDEESELAEALQENDKEEGVELPGLGTAYFVAYEHINEDLKLIFRLGEQLFLMSGYYSSFDADEWDQDIFEVEAKEKTIVVYERLNNG